MQPLKLLRVGNMGVTVKNDVALFVMMLATVAAAAAFPIPLCATVYVWCNDVAVAIVAVIFAYSRLVGVIISIFMLSLYFSGNNTLIYLAIASLVSSIA